MNCLEVKQDYKGLTSRSKSLMSAAYEAHFELSSNSFQFKMTYEKFTAEELVWLAEYFKVLKDSNVLSARKAANDHVQTLQKDYKRPYSKVAKQVSAR